MERVKALINKLQEQLDQHTDPSSMAITVQMLQAELQQVQQSAPKSTGSGKISVMMPANHKSSNPSYSNGNSNNNGSNSNGYHTEHVAEVAVVKKERNGNTAPVQAVPQKSYSFNPVLEIPTLANQDGVKELNDVIGNYGSSLNDQLKSKNTELAETLTEAPIKDLKKGIGINDRYVFINELFRGDETMYERSIKTINNFHILQEAEFWMERELKLKLGWNEGKERVQHFYQLVKRRFA